MTAPGSGLALSKWAVVDVQLPGQYEILVGPWGRGRSLRRSVRGPAGRALSEVVAEVAEQRVALDRVARVVQGEQVRVMARPVLGPSGIVHAVACTVVGVGEELSPAMELGGWEWDIPTRTGMSSGELFDTYRVPAELRAPYSVPQYLARVEVPDSPGALDLWSRVVAAQDEEVLYQPVQGKRFDGVVRQFLICGRAVFFDQAAPQLFRGVSIDVTDVDVPRTSSRTDADLLSAVLDHIEQSLSIVDVQHQQVVRWLTQRSEGVAWGSDGLLRPLVHPDDHAELDATFTQLSQLPLRTRRRIQVRMRGNQREWVPVSLDFDVYLRDDERGVQVTMTVRVDRDDL